MKPYCTAKFHHDVSIAISVAQLAGARADDLAVVLEQLCARPPR